ncbi:hypothetical protein BG262_00050 [Floricoccus penangensis]|uniref:HTH cro/C1-type domain-containing protein n=1 Tax=Floricoccus penangensis TaxID=1859475 RepID=A0A9Q5JI17_9LACT|nr:helix-turn-helix transcriptional regulator [Floricoccus penangensis]OFI47950.1 hypothetical protein BG262_00050 [Floricoccus penangensis]
MKIGQIIKEERTHRELTQEDMANEFFVTRQLISKWENDKSYPDLEQVVKISEYFDLPLDYLLKEDKKMVNELNFDSKKKKWMKYLIYIFTIIFVYLLITLFIITFFDLSELNKNDIQVTKVEKYHLPQQDIINKSTGQKVTLAEDFEYVIYFKTQKPFIDLPTITSTNTINEDRNNILINSAIVHKKIFGKKDKESTFVIRSQRENLNIDKEYLNKNKSIYLDNINKRKKNINFNNISTYSDLLLTKDELDKLPITEGKMPY